MLHARLSFEFRTVAGFLYIAFAYTAFIYWVLRIREFYADRVAGLIAGQEVGKNVLERAARAAKYTKFPVWYFMTHPKPADRLDHYQNFSGVYEYSLTKILVCAFALSCYVVLVPISTLSFQAAFTHATVGLTSLVALVPMAAIIVAGALLQFHIIFHLVISATIGANETFIKVTLKCLAMIVCGLINLEIISLLFFRREIVTSAREMIDGTNIINACACLLVTHWTYYLMARKFRAEEGSALGLRLQRSWQWCGGIISVVITTTITTGASLLWQDSAENMSAVVVVSIVAAAISGLAYLRWRAAVRADAKRITNLKNTLDARQIALGQRYVIGFDTVRPPLLTRLACVAAVYFGGLYLILQMAAINESGINLPRSLPEDLRLDYQITMRSSRDGAYFLAWTFFIFPLQYLIIRRKGPLFPAKKVMTAVGPIQSAPCISD
jgi:hypothetical protein